MTVPTVREVLKVERRGRAMIRQRMGGLAAHAAGIDKLKEMPAGPQRDRIFAHMQKRRRRAADEAHREWMDDASVLRNYLLRGIPCPS